MSFSFTGWDAVWGFWLISVLTAIVGCVVTCYMGKSVILVSTSFVGSYLFMRSWTLFFPGYFPSEAELLDTENPIEPDAMFWVFIAIWAVGFLIFTVFQCKRNDSNEELDDHFNKA